MCQGLSVTRILMERNDEMNEKELMKHIFTLHIVMMVFLAIFGATMWLAGNHVSNNTKKIVELSQKCGVECSSRTNFVGIVHLND